METRTVQTSWRDLWMVTVGTVILAFGTAIFVLPLDFVTGGIAGLTVVLSALFPQRGETEIVFLLTWGLFLLGWILFGARFAGRTLISAAVYPPAVTLFMSTLGTWGVVSGFTSMVLSAAGGVIVGVGCAMTFLGGGSTGGTDVLAFLICRCVKRIRLSNAILLIDAAIILGGAIVLRDPVRTGMGMLSAAVNALMVDLILRGTGR